MKSARDPKKRIDDMNWFMLIFVTAAICYFILGLVGCASTNSSQATTDTKVYELTLSGQLDGQPFVGHAIGSAAPSHQLVISSTDDIPYVINQTCHRFEKHEKVITQGWFPTEKQWKFNYIQASTIEDTGDCPLRTCAYSSTVGAPPVQCFVIDFKNPKYQHVAENICNGSDGGPGSAVGTLQCHTKTGLIERVRFDEPMRLAGPIQNPAASDGSTYQIPDQCSGKFIDNNNELFEYIMPAKECYAIFYAVKPPYARLKLHVIPYTEPLMTNGGK